MYAYSSDLLLPYKHPLGNSWENLDNPELYEHNLKIQPLEWPWRNKSVNYSWNSNGYRAPEWSDIDWESANVLMGCSYALGLGVDDSETITAKIPNGVNLGQCGISVYNIQYNTLRLIDAGIRPRSVKIIIPDLVRSVYWGDIDWRDLTPHDFDLRGHELVPVVRDYYRSLLAIEPMAELGAYMTVRSVEALWRSVGVDCDLYHHWLPKNPRFVMAPCLPEPVDFARDLINNFGHPGPQTLANWRSVIWDQI